MSLDLRGDVGRIHDKWSAVNEVPSRPILLRHHRKLISDVRSRYKILPTVCGPEQNSCRVWLAVTQGSVFEREFLISQGNDDCVHPDNHLGKESVV